jgi:Tfp pilus assembly protein FimT
MKWLSALVVAATIGNAGCNLCGPEQHAITTGSSALMMGGDVPARQIQYVTYRLTEPPATHEAFQFVFSTLEGMANGEGVALTFSGTDAVTQEVVTLVLALPVSLRQGDEYRVGATFDIDVTSPARTNFWGAHDLADATKADVAFVVATYSFPPAAYTPNFTAVSSTGTIRVVNRTSGHLQLDLNLTFTDAAGRVRTVTGDAQANTEKSAALCN